LCKATKNTGDCVAEFKKAFIKKNEFLNLPGFNEIKSPQNNSATVSGSLWDSLTVSSE
jgi:hypothetical protein